MDLSGLGGMLADDIAFDIRDKYAIIYAPCVNPDTPAAVIRSPIAQLSGPAPDSDIARSVAAAAAATAAP